MDQQFYFPDILRAPDVVFATTEEGQLRLYNDSPTAWTAAGISLETTIEATGVRIALEASAPTRQLTLRWQGAFPSGTRYLADHWERGYGDLEWRGLVPERVLPWYFLAQKGNSTTGYGVEVRPNALCHWKIDDCGISLFLNVGAGDLGVQLGGRRLEVATIRQIHDEGRSAFETARELCRTLCSAPRLAKQPVYGGNDWYYAYGNNSRASILRDAALLSELSPSKINRPFMVIDDGWQGCRAPDNGGPWHISAPQFGDMSEVAAEMKATGVRPGLWFRPLLTTSNVPGSWRFPRRNGQPHNGGLTLDPSVPEVLEIVAADMVRFREWGFELVKHDFSMMDIFGRWGFDFRDNPTRGGWTFADRSRTTAEIILDFFQTIRKAAGDDMLIIGCNTIGHLGAGIFEIQRTGDDTSGHEWERTRKMGVNTLAFRMPQHDTFFANDADCVGLTTKVPWELNRQWLDVLAHSGTPLFVSADPKALGVEQCAALRDAFELAATVQSPAEPLDWLDTTTPTQWKTDSGIKKYQWSGCP